MRHCLFNSYLHLGFLGISIGDKFVDLDALEVLIALQLKWASIPLKLTPARHRIDGLSPISREETQGLFGGRLTIDGI